MWRTRIRTRRLGLLLYWDPPAVFYFFPRYRFASDADWQAASELVARKVPAA